MDTYYNAFDDAKGREDRLTAEEQMALRDHINQKIQIHLQRKNTGRIRKWLPYAAAAASIIVILAAAIYVNNKPNGPSAARGILATEGDIAPGGNRATLTLAGGQVVALDERKSRIIMGDRVMYKDGQSIDGTPQANEDATTKSPATNWLELSTPRGGTRSEEHTSELQSLMRISYALFCLKKKQKTPIQPTYRVNQH